MAAQCHYRLGFRCRVSGVRMEEVSGVRSKMLSIGLKERFQVSGPRCQVKDSEHRAQRILRRKQEYEVKYTDIRFWEA